MTQNTQYRLAELERKLANLITVGKVTEVNTENRTLKLKVGDNQTDWLNWPVKNGQNFTSWCPPRVGQQYIIGNPSGDTANGVIIGEIYSDAITSGQTDAGIDETTFNDGSFIRHNSNTGEMQIHAAQHLVLTAPRVDIN